MARGGMCDMHAPPDMAGQCAGSTHPTGMYSCLSNFLKSPQNRNRFYMEPKVLSDYLSRP